MGGRIQLDPAWDVEHSGLPAAGKAIARALQEYGAYCGDYAGANVLYAENSPEAVQAWEGILDSKDIEAVFTPEMIRRHFRVLDMGNLLPGQNLKVAPPYVISFAVAGETTPARIDQLARAITVQTGRTHAAKIRASWILYPRSTRMDIDGQALASGSADINLAGAAILRLTGPDGTTNTWQLRPSNLP